jgi:glycosyltransferase involved in cell wall biosynthesis
MFDLNHIFGRLGDWFYLQPMRKRPSILTITTRSIPVAKSIFDRIDRFVVEHSEAKEELRALGIADARVRLIYPPIDLNRFTPAACRNGPFTVLFASSPDEGSWLEARGIPEILDAAAVRPKIRFRLLWRPWGNSEPRVRRLVAERKLRNVEIAIGCFRNMPDEYNNAHVTVAPFLDSHRSKATPNSIMESMACGRPVLVTPLVGLADLIKDAQAGVICGSSGEAIAEGLDRLAADWNFYSCAAHKVATDLFGAEKFLAEYRRLYSEVLSQ